MRVTRQLAISSRTLQRQLREEGTTCQAVLASAREDLARYYHNRAELGSARQSADDCRRDCQRGASGLWVKSYGPSGRAGVSQSVLPSPRPGPTGPVSARPGG